MRRGRGARRAVAGGAAVTVVALLAVGGVYAAASERGWSAPDRAEAAVGAEASPPLAWRDAWDPRVLDLVAFVERERELSFRHPVPIDFVAPEELSQRLAAGIEQSVAVSGNGRDTEAGEIRAAMMRALGLQAGATDPWKAFGQRQVSNSVAFYDPVEERITAPAVPLDPNQRSVLVHELTHALQDQHFELDKVKTTQATAEPFRAVVEGDATNIQHRWVAQLPDAERTALYEHSVEAAADRHDVGNSDAAFQEAVASVPYTLGETMVATLVAGGGEEAVDDVLRHPPSSPEAVFDPTRYLDQPERTPVSPPPVLRGETLLQRGSLGPLAWYYLLAETARTGPALRAAYGWASDAYVLVERDGRVCVRANVDTDGAEDAEELSSAAAAWVAAVPDAWRRVASQGMVVQVFGCDPGVRRDEVRVVNTIDAMYVPWVVSVMLLEELENGRLDAASRCEAIEYAASYSAGELRDLVSTPLEERTAGEIALSENRRFDAELRCA